MKAVAAGMFLVLSVFAAAQGPYSGGAGRRDGGQVNKAAIERLTLAQKKADAAFKKSPKDASARKAYIEANNRHGLACMVTDAVDRKLKYRMALADFRKVLKVDPKNSVAKQNYDLIVSIYKSMGRPVPR